MTELKQAEEKLAEVQARVSSMPPKHEPTHLDYAELLKILGELVGITLSILKYLRKA